MRNISVSDAVWKELNEAKKLNDKKTMNDMVKLLIEVAKGE